MPESKRRKPLTGPKHKESGGKESQPEETPLVPPSVDYPAQADDKPVIEPSPQPAKRRRRGVDRMHVL
ncbi:hypothetical protein C5L14_00820 [Labrys okinawensis]|uniref:Uncharacterized protein n=1 Tax=Labrys okinawensis TaxID=346911 RepID=A0A2S9QIJ1_9HYPH|nr:hypothetical protein [Labrys okinawensis]PRH89168.1 hypothetical protein C5L14_00820 [Labrys okinawensis]